MATLNEMKERFKRKAQPKRASQGSSRLIDRMRANKAEAEAAEPERVDDRLVKETPGGPEPVRRKYMRPGGRFEAITTDGHRDGILLFGKYKDGRPTISGLAKEDKGYLLWICTKDKIERGRGEPGFNPLLIEIITEWVERV